MSDLVSATILIVDDTPANLRLLSTMLSKQGYQVRPAPNGTLALRSAQAAPPDLILLDINMPDINGYEVCRLLKSDETTRQVPVIFISALGEIDDKMRAFHVGGVDYITKPFQLEEVLARVKTHLTLRQLQTQLEAANRDLEQRVIERTAELIRLNEAYARFLPREFLGFLGKESVVDIQLGDQVQKGMTVLFSDIRDFTKISEIMGTQDNFNFINRYLQEVSPIIRNHNGFIDKYLGDGIMALFPEKTDNAIQAAIAMQKEVITFNGRYVSEGFPLVRVGIGLHTGGLMLGIIGEEQRLQGTVISDAVNLASRLEGLTTQYGVSIIISQQSLMETNDPNAYQHRFLGQAQVKGKMELVPIYEIFDGDPPSVAKLKSATKAQFEEALQRYLDGDVSGALALFQEVVAQNPLDKAAQFYCRQLAAGLPA